MSSILSLFSSKLSSPNSFWGCSFHFLATRHGPQICICQQLVRLSESDIFGGQLWKTQVGFLEEGAYQYFTVT